MPIFSEEQKQAFLLENTRENEAKITEASQENEYTDAVQLLDGMRFRILQENNSQLPENFKINDISFLLQRLQELRKISLYQDCSLASFHLCLGDWSQNSFLLSNEAWKKGTGTRFEGLGNHTVPLFQIEGWWVVIDPTTSEYIDVAKEKMDFLVLAASDRQKAIDMVTKVYGSSWQIDDEEELQLTAKAYYTKLKPVLDRISSHQESK